MMVKVNRFVNIFCGKEPKMKRRMKILTMLVALAIVFASFGDAFARRSGGGGRSRSSSFKRSAPKKSAPKIRKATTQKAKSKKAIAKKTKSQKAIKGTSKRSTAKPKRSPAQQKSFEQASKNGTVFKSKSAAQSAFKKKNAGKYGSKYATKPATRPSHVPQTTSVGGSNVNISFNASHGGYGYMHPTLGTFMMYNAMSDAIMMQSLMRRNHYIVDTPHVAVAPVVIHRRSFGFGKFLLCIIVICCVVGGGVYLSKRTSA